MIDLLLNGHGKHLQSCRDGQFFNHTLPLHACGGTLPVFLPPTLLESAERDTFAAKYVLDARVDLGTAGIRSGHATN